MKTIYLAAPYRAPTPEGIRDNVDRVKQIARELADCGVLPIVPHLAMGFCSDDPEDWNTALYLGLKLLEKCDCVLVCGPYSEGVIDECTYARGLGKPVHELSRFKSVQDVAYVVRSPYSPLVRAWKAHLDRMAKAVKQ